MIDLFFLASTPLEIEKAPPIPDVSILDGLLNYVSAQPGAITAFATVVIAIATLVTAVLTRSLAKENRLLRKAGTEPEIVAFLSTDKRYETMVTFVLANVGQGPAKNVEFAFEADEEDFTAHNVSMRNTTGRKAISFLPQGDRIESFFGAGHELFAEPILNPFKVIVKYENIAGKKCEGRSELDVRQFDGLITLGTPAEQTVAKALKDIATHFRRVMGSNNRLRVETISKMEADEMNREMAKSAKEALKRAREKEKKGSADSASEE